MGYLDANAPWLRRLEMFTITVTCTLTTAGLGLLLMDEWRAWALLWLAALGVFGADIMTRLAVVAWALANHSRTGWPGTGNAAVVVRRPIDGSSRTIALTPPPA